MLKHILRRMHPKNKALLLLVLCFLFGAGVGYSLHSPQAQSLSAWGPVRTPPGEYKMIRPLLACDFPYDESNERMRILKSQLNSDIFQAQKSDSLIHASVYVRSMNTGGSLGIGETELYNPASMFKVVLMMTYARMSKFRPYLFEKKLTMTEGILRQGDEDRRQQDHGGEKCQRKRALFQRAFSILQSNARSADRRSHGAGCGNPDI